MLSLALAVLAAAPRTFDWASATVEFPALKAYSPLAPKLLGPFFVKLGGQCYRPGDAGQLPLYEKSYQLEIACFGKDESSATCDGKPLTCARCSMLRLMNGPFIAQRMYGDGVIRANLGRGCAGLCEGPGIPWADFEALVAFVGRTQVVLSSEPAQAELYRTREACLRDKSDLAPDFQGGEPAIPG